VAQCAVCRRDHGWRSCCGHTMLLPAPVIQRRATMIVRRNTCCFVRLHAAGVSHGGVHAPYGLSGGHQPEERCCLLHSRQRHALPVGTWWHCAPWWQWCALRALCHTAVPHMRVCAGSMLVHIAAPTPRRTPLRRPPHGSSVSSPPRPSAPDAFAQSLDLNLKPAPLNEMRARFTPPVTPLRRS